MGDSPKFTHTITLEWYCNGQTVIEETAPMIHTDPDSHGWFIDVLTGAVDVKVSDRHEPINLTFRIIFDPPLVTEDQDPPDDPA